MLPVQPSCGVVIFKDATSENICPSPAADMISITDQDQRVTGVVLLCARHSELFDRGVELIVLADNGIDHLSIQANIGGKNDARNDEQGAGDDGRQPGQAGGHEPG